MLKINAYAKINLYLDITSRRADGFHDIVSYMQTVDLSDTVFLEKAESGINLSGNYGVEPESDLAYRAAKLFFDCYNLNGGVNVSVDKRIPMQGGLAGGSADAAAVLRGLNKLFDVKRPLPELAELSANLGSDVPFCVVGGSKLTYGRGEIMKVAPAMPACGIVIVKGKTGCSTPAQFKALDLMYNNFADYDPKTDKLSGLIEAIESGNIQGIGDNLYNIFEDAPGYDRSSLNIMKQNGARGTLLSGSGSSVFGIFDDLGSAEKAAIVLNNNGFTAFACEPVAIN